MTMTFYFPFPLFPRYGEYIMHILTIYTPSDPYSKLVPMRLSSIYRHRDALPRWKSTKTNQARVISSYVSKDKKSQCWNWWVWNVHLPIWNLWIWKMLERWWWSHCRRTDEGQCLLLYAHFLNVQTLIRIEKSDTKVWHRRCIFGWMTSDRWMQSDWRYWNVVLVKPLSSWKTATMIHT